MVLEKLIAHKLYLDYCSHGKNKSDNSECVGTILMDLSKAYDCIPHGVLIVKWEEYILDKTASSFLLDYLSRRVKRTKIGPVYSEWVKILSGISQNSVSSPLLFNIFISDWFFFAFKVACRVQIWKKSILSK